MNKPNALALRWLWYEDSKNGWHPSATEAVKDFILWLHSEGGEIFCDKFANHTKRKTPERREG